jgi:hydrogenase/urease accessory protein HupE
MTTVIFLGLTLMLALEQRYVVAAVLGALGLLRGVVAVRQIQAALPSDDD